MTQSFSNVFVAQFEKAAGKAAVFELKVRLLADKVSSLAKFAHEKTLGPILTPLIVHFTDNLTSESKGVLERSLFLRNKVIHSDFKAAADKLEQPSGGVIYFKDVPAKGKKIVGWLNNVLAGFQKGNLVREHTAEEVSIFGWLLEGGRNGTFVECERVFVEATSVIDELIEKSP